MSITCRRGHVRNDGILACPDCRKLRYLKRRDIELQQNREWIAANKVRYQKKQKQYKESNAERVKGWLSAWVEANPVHAIWRGIKARCYHSTCKAYPRYGGRGIGMCDRWLGEDGYKNFERDMGARPTPKHTIERINNNGDYEPGNCVWATRKQQQWNKHNSVRITIGGMTRVLPEWCEISGLGPNVINKRIKLGWDERDVLLPSKEPRKHPLIPVAT